MGQTKTSERKKDHIELAFQSVVEGHDKRFNYEPLFNAHPQDLACDLHIANKVMKAPLWISSMTGGTKEAATINSNLAKVAGEFGLGMGLGSCRIILDDDTYLKDFQLRRFIGDQPLFANLGIAQMEELFANGQEAKVKKLISRTETDGLIIHINPLQEWLQPEGDKIKNAPIDTIKRSLDLNIPIIVKEVGQGMGPASLKALMQLPVEAIDFAAHGGTNFSKLELSRASSIEHEVNDEVSSWGHSADEMVQYYNQLDEELGVLNQTKTVIVSGGVKGFVDGYYFVQKIKANAAYGQASAFLKHARADYQELRNFVRLQLEGYKLAQAYLRVKD